MQRDLPREPGSHHAAPKPGPDQERGPQANPGAKPAHPGGGTPSRGNRRRAAAATEHKTKTRQARTRPKRRNKTRRGEQAGTARNTKARQTRDQRSKAEPRGDQNKPKQNQASKTKTSQNKAGGLGNSQGRSQSSLVCQCSIPSETSKTGRAAVVSARPQPYPRAPSTRQSAHVCVSVPVKNVQNREDC